MAQYDIIVADPPWKHLSNSDAAPGRNPRRHYPLMSDTELRLLNIPKASPSLMFLWTTVPMLARSMWIMRSWGFDYVSQMVWVKDKIGTGHWCRNRHEIVLIAKHGAFPCPSPAPFESSVIEAPRREHSRKPESLQDRIDEIWPDARRLEMFARRRRRGWDLWGNDLSHFPEGVE
jgi:N6-adenosine-specific RNA methylase IME4